MKPDPQQKTIDFNLSARRGFIEKLKLPASEISTRRALLANVRSLLLAIDDFARRDSVCWASVATLCQKLAWSEAKVHFYLSLLRRLDLLKTKFRGQHKTAEQVLNWSRLVDWSGESPTFAFQASTGPVQEEYREPTKATRQRSKLKPPEVQTLESRGPMIARQRSNDCAPEVQSLDPNQNTRIHQESRILTSDVCRQETSPKKPTYTPQPSFLDQLDEIDPGDNHALNDWYESASRAAVNPLLLPDNETDRLYVFAAAEHVLRCRDKLRQPPVACFKSLIAKRKAIGGHVADIDYDRGAARIKAMRQRPEYARKPEDYLDLEDYSASPMELQYA